MARTATRDALLRVAMQDLAHGKRLLERRLPALADAATDAALAALIRGEAELAARQCARLDVEGGPDNLWMAGIVDDADRDARSHQPGVLLDIALVGAVRKAKAAEIVSSETAIALARTEAPERLPGLTANHAEEGAADRRLAGLLDRLTG